MAGDSGLRMPAALMERARALVNDRPQDWQAPAARDAATVVMVADREDGIHIYLQRRVRTMAFAAGMYVFPGGAVEDQDVEIAAGLAASAPAGSGAAALLLTGTEAIGMDTLAARCAAVRETEEESSHDLGDPLALRYIAHWVTPEVEERRFDTRFYAQVVDTPHGVTENSGESDAALWVSPAQALADYAGGRMAMLPPTVAVLNAFATAAAAGHDAAAAISSVAAIEILPLMPSPVADPGGEAGVRWVLIDVRTGAEVTALPSAPAGSEAGGVHTSSPSASSTSDTAADLD